MQCALKILLIIVTHTFFSVTIVGANPQNDLPVGSHSLLLEKEKADFALEVAHTPSEEEEAQIAKEALPLVKVAHKNVLDLLHLFFVAKPIHIPSDTPLLQHLGIRINWFEYLWNFWANGQKRYGGGIDLHFSGPIQLSVDVGYLSFQAKGIKNKLEGRCRSEGIYGLGALLYVIYPNPLTNAYFGIAYGRSLFKLMTLYNHDMASIAKPLVAGWIKIVAGSELRLVSQLYGGMQLGMAHLLHGKKNDGPKVSNYSIPGYGKIVNKIMFDITLYIKWSISCLEKKIII